MAVFAAIVLIACLIIAVINASAKSKKAERERVTRTLPTYEDTTVRANIQAKKIWRGMTEQQLIDSWGQPSKVTNQVLKTKVRSTLRYGSNRYGSSVYLENGRVTGWRQTA